MGIKLELRNLFIGMIKIGSTALLPTDAATKNTVATLIGSTAIELLKNLKWKKNNSIENSIEKLPEKISHILNDFTMPAKCSEDLANNLFTIEKIEKYAKSENIIGTLESSIIEICKNDPECDIKTLQIKDIAKDISKKVMSILLEDKYLLELVNLLINRSILENSWSAEKKLTVILNKLSNAVDRVLTDYAKNPSEKTIDNHEIRSEWITIPYASLSEHHIKRNNESQRVKRILRQPKTAISGIVGGIGKTELLQAVCERVLKQNLYQYVGWINYSGDIKTNILDSANPKYIGRDDPVKKLLIFAAEHRQEMILFVDNVNSDDKNLDFLRNIACTVIVTTRNKGFLNFEVTNLDLLTEEEAKKMYLEYSGQKKENNYVEPIVSLCGYHPLAIELVGKYAKNRNNSNSEVYEKLVEHGYDLEGLVDTNWSGNRNELIITQLSKLYNLSNLSPSEQEVHILKCFAILPSTPIKKQFVDSIMDQDKAHYVAFDELVNDSWISCVQSGWYMHDIVKSVIKREMTIRVDDCADFLEKLCMYATQVTEYQVQTSSLVLLISVAEFFSDVRGNTLLMKIYNAIGYVFQETTDSQNAQKWFGKAWCAIKKSEQSKAVIMIKGDVCNNIALCCCQKLIQKKCNENLSKQEVQSVVALYNKAIESYKKLLGGNDVDPLIIKMKILTAENNKAVCLFNGGKEETAITSLNEIIAEKLQLVHGFINRLLILYSRLLSDTEYTNNLSITDGFNSLKRMRKIIAKYKIEKKQSNIDSCFHANMSLSDVMDALEKYRILFDNEMIPSLVRSCDCYAVYQVLYGKLLSDSTEIINRLSDARKKINFALDVCEQIPKVTIFESSVWGSSSMIYFAAWQLSAISNYREVAIEHQMNGIGFLEHIFKESNDNQSKEPLIRAYENMYTYTGEDEWKLKAYQLTSQDKIS